MQRRKNDIAGRNTARIRKLSLRLKNMEMRIEPELKELDRTLGCFLAAFRPRCESRE
jgi:hypothetical protein